MISFLFPCIQQSRMLVHELKSSAFNTILAKITTESDFTPLTPEAEEARELAQKELAKLKYQRDESLFSRFILWVQEILKKLLNMQHGNLTLSDILTLLAIGIFFLALVFFAFRFGISLRKQRATGKPRKQKGILFLDDSRDANELFSAAAKAAENNNWNIAIVEIFRAIIKELDEHEIITLRTGSTAFEAANLAAQAVGQKKQFIAAANIFNTIFYGSYQANLQDLNFCIKLADYMRVYTHSHSRQTIQNKEPNGATQTLTENLPPVVTQDSFRNSFSTQTPHFNTSQLTAGVEK